MQTLLVPLDGSALAERVLPYVRELAPPLGARVCLIRVISHVDRDTAMAELFSGAYGLIETADAIHERTQRAWDMLRQQAEGYLATQALNLRNAGLEVDFEVLFGRPDAMIVEAAHERHATLIAMATHGYGGLKRLALGSVAQRVLHAATVPLILVRAWPAEELVSRTYPHD